MKQHKVSHKTVSKHQPLSMRIICIGEVYARIKNIYEVDTMWMIYINSSSGRQLFWHEEVGSFHRARFRVKEIAECLGIDPKNISFDDLSAEEGDEVKIEDFTSIIRKIDWIDGKPVRDMTPIKGDIK